MNAKTETLPLKIFTFVRAVLSMVLFVAGNYLAFDGEYARACYDLVLAFYVYPDMWLPNASRR